MIPMPIILLIIGLLLIIGSIVIHEWGHFIQAKRNGVEVEEFGIFFPPRIYSRTTKSGWVFSINALPLGGFVRLKGEHDSDTEPGTFGASSQWVKTKILLAGISMNFITGLILFTILALLGMPQIIDNQYTYHSDTKTVNQKVLISDVVTGSQAEKAGLKNGDQLIAISTLNGSKKIYIHSSTTLPSITKQFAGQKTIVYYSRNGIPKTVGVALLPASEVIASQKTNHPKYELGVAPQQINIYRSTWSAPIVAVRLSLQLIWATIIGLGHTIAGLGGLVAGLLTHNTVARQNAQTAATANVTGPVGIYKILSTSSSLGYQFVLFMVAYISIVLAFMNALPIPVVDGGKLYLILITRAIKRPLSAKREEAISLVTIVILLLLFVLITIADVKRFY